ncbi:MAG TPA: UDP-3-O-(3-hydroxymyristoyl)glucosamine N-acyltransferase [Gemmataceae bacterium]|nr:UDP-3-O-(3-hydroxymyristoyl)glucosamine N-acyltransferase [Gemmataceae bacterium]
MTLTVRQLAERVRGEVLGDADLPIFHARTLGEAGPGDITFVADSKHLAEWHTSRASAAVVPTSVPVNGRPIIRVTDPIMAFAQIVRDFRHRPDDAEAAIDPTAHVHPTARLAAGVTVGPFVVVGEGTEVGANSVLHAGAVVGRFCKLGADVTLFPHVVLYDDCALGNRVVIHANSVIGADGFGYRLADGRHVKVPQLGSVEIEDDVEIGACTTIDRGTFGPTRIGAGTKIDNQVQIGHNCQIGKHNVLVSQVGISGSVTTGDYVVMGGQVGLADHVTIGDRTQIGGKSGVYNDIPADSRVLGHPAVPYQKQGRIWVSLEKLPEICRDVKRIKKKLGLDDAA